MKGQLSAKITNYGEIVVDLYRFFLELNKHFITFVARNLNFLLNFK